jgi:probable phosphoglycerate mutase
MLLLLIRHALTPVTGIRLSGWTPGLHLSESGEEEAAALAQRLDPVKIDAIYSSPLERVVDTARPTARAKKLRIRIREELGEVRYGSWEGRKLESLAKTKLWRTVQGRPSAVRFPDGEALRETQARAIAAVESIVAAHEGDTVAVFTHADIIRLLVAYYAGVHLDLYQRIAIGTASVSAIWLGRGGPRILKVNDTGSLAALTPSKPRRSR